MLDFQAIKKQTTIEQVATFLGLELKQEGPALRGKCPVCDSSNHRALAVSKDRQAAYCFAAQKGGDMLWLISHARNIGVRKAAEDLADHIGHMDKMVTVPQKPTSKESDPTAEKGPTSFAPLTYLAYEHEAVQALGLDPNTAERLGIGYANKGTARGFVVVPMFDHTELVGYLGIPKGTQVWLPKNIKAVVE